MQSAETYGNQAHIYMVMLVVQDRVQHCMYGIVLKLLKMLSFSNPYKKVSTDFPTSICTFYVLSKHVITFNRVHGYVFDKCTVGTDIA